MRALPFSHMPNHILPLSLSLSLSLSRSSSRAVRPLQAGDLEALLKIQLACYEPYFIESAQVYARRLASPVNCSLVHDREGVVGAYLAAYRTRFGKVTPLHGDFDGAREEPDTLYLHDMAVLPAHAGQGMARALLERIWAHGRDEGLRYSALVSVQGTGEYWSRQGYAPRPLDDAHERLRLASYGEGAVYMTREL
jgi:GNAT superfamily N-acetyltransferase